jgi:hypothetical protein
VATSDQADLSAGRTLRLATSTHGSAPTNGTTEPDFVLGPQAPGLLPTTGFLIGLTAPSSGSATAAAGGFTVTVWWRDPVLKRYFSFAAVSIAYGEAFGTADIDAAELYIQIANVSGAGDVDVTIAEQ